MVTHARFTAMKRKRVILAVKESTEPPALFNVKVRFLKAPPLWGVFTVQKTIEASAKGSFGDKKFSLGKSDRRLCLIETSAKYPQPL